MWGSDHFEESRVVILIDKSPVENNFDMSNSGVYKSMYWSLVNGHEITNLTTGQYWFQCSQAFISS
jgi:hypothetical protein